MHTFRRVEKLLFVVLILCSRPTFAGTITADVRVTKQASSLLVERGDPLAWTITVSNFGPGAAENVVMTDILPPQLLFNSIVAPASYSCVTPAPGTNGTVTCNRLSSMPNGTNDVFTLNTTIAPNAAPGAFGNTARATTTSTDPIFNNNGNGISAVVPPFPDVQLTKTAGAGPFEAGDDIDFTITVTNAGPGSAHNVTVMDTLPAGSTLVSAIPTQGTCSGSVTCNLGTIASGGTASIALIVTSPPTPGPLTNIASVTVFEFDPDQTNNSASATVTTTAPSTPPAAAGAAPTLSPWMLSLLALALAAVALKMRL